MIGKGISDRSEEKIAVESGKDASSAWTISLWRGAIVQGRDRPAPLSALCPWGLLLAHSFSFLFANH